MTGESREVLPVTHDDCTILITCYGEGLQKQSLQKESTVAGMKTLEVFNLETSELQKHTKRSAFLKPLPFPKALC